MILHKSQTYVTKIISQHASWSNITKDFPELLKKNLQTRFSFYLAMWEAILSHLEKFLFYTCNIFGRKSLRLCMNDGSSWYNLITKGATDLIEVIGVTLLDILYEVEFHSVIKIKVHNVFYTHTSIYSKLI